MRGQAGFWDIDERYARLSEAGDPLEKLNALVPWEVFRKPLAKALKRSDGAKGGRPPYDSVMMFKIMVLQALYGLSDDQAEFQIQERLSFMRFLGLGLGDRVPDAKTIWLFREHLAQAEAVENLFARFDKHLAKAGYLAMGGQIVDATIVAAPKQRNTDAEKADIKAGKVPDAWKEKPAKLRQKDLDARWTVNRRSAKRISRRPRWRRTGRPSSATSPFLRSATRTTPRSIAGTASSEAGTSRARQPMTERSFAMCSTAATPARRSGRTRPTDRRRTKSGWRRTVTSRTSTTRNRRAGR